MIRLLYPQTHSHCSAMAIHSFGSLDIGLEPTIVSPAAISGKTLTGRFSRSKDTIEAGTFDISPVETVANFGANVGAPRRGGRLF